MPKSEDDLKAIFARIDKDGSGFITVEDLDLVFARAKNKHTGVLSKGAQKAKDRMIAEFKEHDLNGDGKTSEDEFVKSYMKNQEEIDSDDE